jgi:hypothetical protein
MLDVNVGWFFIIVEINEPVLLQMGYLLLCLLTIEGE